MKLRNRLAVAFFIMLIVPGCMVYICFQVLNGYQTRILQDAFGVDTENGRKLMETDTVVLFDQLARKAEDVVMDDLEKKTEQFYDSSHLEQLNEKIEPYYSFLFNC